MKKLMTILLALLLIVPSISALAAPTGEVVVWCWDPNFNLYAINKAADVYAAINPDVTINCIETGSEDCETKQTIAFTSGDTSGLPDIILMQDNSGQKFLNTFPGEYTAMDGLVDYDSFAQYKVNYFTVDGAHYSVPFDSGAAAFFVRADYLEAAGYTLADVTDVTWDQLIEVGLAVKAATGKFLFSTGSDYNDFIMLMTQSAGTWFFDEEGNPQLDTSPVIRAVLETCKKLHDSGIVLETSSWDAYISSLNDGSAGGTIQGCWIIGSIVQAKDQKGLWSMTNVPRLDVEGGTNYSSQGGSSWVVPASAKNPEAAIDFLSKTFGGSVEFYQTILQDSGAIATYLPAAEGSAYSAPHSFFKDEQPVFKELMGYASLIPQIKLGMYNYESRDALSNALQDYINGADLDTVLASAQGDVAFLME
jgi:lactose/L-arabinose transport system substrate-binding protein